MKESIERILKAESDAKAKVVEAKKQASDILRQARDRKASLVEDLREEARKQAQEMIRNATGEAKEDGQRIIEEARKQAQLVIESAQLDERSFLEAYIKRLILTR